MIKRFYIYMVATFAVAAFVALLSLILDISLRAYIISSYIVALRIFAHNFVVDALIVTLLCAVVLILALAFKFALRRRREFSIPWPLVYGLPAALLTVFVVAVHLNTAVLPSFNAPLSKKVNAGIIISIPFVAAAFTYTAYYFKKFYGKKGFRLISSIFVGLAVVTTIIGYVVPVGNIPKSDIPIENAPNILIITIDALRRDHVSYYGEGRASTPNLDKLAEKSIVFEWAYTPSPWTIPSMYSMNTSRYPSVHGADDYHRGNDELVTLAHVLKSHGYSTEAYVANSIMDRELGFDRGFDTYRLFEDTPLLEWTRYSSLYLFVARITGEESYFAPPPDTTQWLTDLLSEKLSKKRGKPFFIWAHYLDPHGPLTPPVEYAEKKLEITDDVKHIIETGGYFRKKEYGLALYEAEVEYIDNSLGEVFDVIEEEGLSENTLIIVTSDHGEEFFEHGRYGHARTHYNEVMAIPLVIYVPGGKHTISDLPVSLLDIMPMVLSYVGIEAPDNLSGRDILQIYDNKNEEPDPSYAPVFFDQTRYDPYMKSICSYPLTLTRTGDKEYVFELVDMTIGYGPEDIVEEPDPDVFTGYRSKLDEWVEEIAVESAELGETGEVDMDNIRKERLEELGYF